MDTSISSDEQSIVRKQRKNALFYGTSDTFKFIAGVMLAASMAIILPAFTAAVNTAGLVGAISGLTASAPVGLALLAAAVVTTGIAVGAQYMASRNYQSANFDALEVNAKHTAKYLVNEIKDHNMCLTEEPKRIDGKSWLEYAQTRTDDKQQGMQL